MVATACDELAGVRERMRALGVASIEVVVPGGGRRLLMGAAPDPFVEAEMVVSLRAEGDIAVVRPDGGAALVAWLRDTRPVIFGDRLSVCHVFAEHDRSALPGLIELGLGGFGNGHHPTTRVMVELLMDRINGGERVLDVGCGSGILGLCALKLGASQVTAVDSNPHAVTATRRNAELNAMADHVHTAADLRCVADAFDVVLANVARAGIVELASQLVCRVAPGGLLAVGGITPAQCDQVVGFLRPMVEIERRTQDQWTTLALTTP